MRVFFLSRVLITAFFLVNGFVSATITYDGTSTLCIQQTQVTPVDTNDAKGLVWFQNGFKLPLAGNFFVDIVLPVNGQIDLNGGTLTLARDLHLASDATLTDSSGASASATIDAQGKSIFLSNDLSYSGTTQALNVASNLIIDGRGHMLTIGTSNRIAIAAGATLTLKNMRLALATTATSPFTAGSNTSTLVLENVTVGLANDCTWATGAMVIKGKTLLLGINGRSFINTSTANFTISSNSCLTLLDGVTYYHNNSGTTNFIMTDNTSSLVLIGATFKGYNTGSTPLVLTKGTMIVDHKSYIQPNSAGINVGDGLSSANNLTIAVRPAATIGITAGTFTCADSLE